MASISQPFTVAEARFTHRGKKNVHKGYVFRWLLGSGLIGLVQPLSLNTLLTSPFSSQSGRRNPRFFLASRAVSPWRQLIL